MSTCHSRSSIFIALAALTLSGCDSLPEWARDKRDDRPSVDGTRIDVLPQSAAFSADPTLAGELPALPEAQLNTRWVGPAPEEHLNLAATLAAQESSTIGDGESYISSIVPSPVVAEGRVFAMDASGHISAHDATHIDTVLWNIKGVAYNNDRAMLAGGLTVDGATLYAVSGDGLVAAFDAASGAEKWRASTNIPVRSAPRSDGVHVYIITIDGQLFALDAATGALKWTARSINEGASFLALASPFIAGDKLIAPFSSGELKVLNPSDGSELWSDVVAASKRSSASSNFGGFSGSPAVKGNALYAVSTNGLLASYRLDNGMSVWQQPISSVNTPWLAGNALYVLTPEAQLVCFNRLDGRVFWAATLPRFEDAKNKHDPYTWSGPVVAGGKVLIAGAHGVLKQFDAASGAEKETIEIPDDVYTSPVVAGGVVYLVRKNAELVVLK